MKNYLLILILLCCMPAFAQEQIVSGTVTDDGNMPLPGATVIIKGTTRGTQTDFDGNYSIEATQGEIIVFSYVGMDAKEVVLADSNTIDVILTVSTNELDEVVVFGYGKTSSKDLTAPIVTVDNEQLTQRSVQSPMSSLQGQVSGLNITSSGAPGASPTVRIRGIGSMQGANEPLYIVDGMFLSNIDHLNGDDIESMSVLKDASSAALYGVRASGGVIVVTTKQGKKNQKAEISYNGYVGFQSVNQRLGMSNSQQYSDYQRSIGRELTINSSMDRFGSVLQGNVLYPSTDTDWYDEVIESAAPIQSHNISIVGGSEKVSYSFGGTFFQQEGISEGKDEFTRYNLRANVDADISEVFKIGANFTVAREQKIGGSTAFGSAYTTPSIMPVYDPNNTEAFPEKFADPGTLNLGGYVGNPMATLAYYNNQKTETYKVLPNFYLEADILKNDKLKFRSAYMQELTFSMYKSNIPEYEVGGNIVNNFSELKKTNNNYYNYVWNNILTYSDVKGKHRYTILGGVELRENNARMLEASVNDVPEGGDELDYIDLGDENTENANDSGSTIRGLSYFTRLSYTYNDKYLLTATFRADGTSKWGDAKTGYFPSVGLGWVVSEEEFMEGLSFINYFKLRGSWGILGNETVPATAGSRTLTSGSMSNSGVFGNTTFPGVLVTDTYSSIDWETIREFNVGFDARFFDNKLTATVDWYKRTTPNMVIDYVLPNNQGTIKDNFGSMENIGLDLSVGWADEVGDFRYALTGTVSFLDNKVTSLQGQPYLTSEGGTRRHIVGETINSFYGYVVEGIYQTQEEIDNTEAVFNRENTSPGDFKFKDLNGDGVIDTDDRTVIGSHIPDFNYGLNISFGYKNFDFVMAFYGVHGNDIYNTKRRGTSTYLDRNIDADLVNNLWTGPGSTNTYPSALALTNSRNKLQGDTDLTSFYIEDGSYFKMQNAQIAYNFTGALLESLKLQKVRLYFNMDNPWSMFTYNGFSPEIESGVDSNYYPMAATYSLGLNVIF